MSRFLVYSITCFVFFMVFGLGAKQELKPNQSQQLIRPRVQFKKILIIGDSLTEGYGVQSQQAFPALLEATFKGRGEQVAVINSGISGSTSASAAQRMKWGLKAGPDLVILALGGNDALRGLSPAAMKKNLGAALDIALQQKVKVLLAGMKAPPNLGASYTKTFEQVFFDLAKEKKVELLPFLLEGVAAEKELNQADGIHPNAKGHQIIAEKVLKRIEAMR